MLNESAVSGIKIPFVLIYRLRKENPKNENAGDKENRTELECRYSDWSQQGCGYSGYSGSGRFFTMLRNEESL